MAEPAVVMVKKPPIERPEDVRMRILVIAAFWAVVIFLGIPIWLWTTSIYRADLPLTEMLAWADGSACKPTFPLEIVVRTPDLKKPEAAHLVQLVQHALDDSNEFAAHHLRLKLSESIRSIKRVNATSNLNDEYDILRDAELSPPIIVTESSALTLLLTADDSTSSPSASIEKHSSVLDIRYASNQIPTLATSSSPLSSFIANQLQDIYTEEQAMIESILRASLASKSTLRTLSASTKDQRSKYPRAQSDMGMKSIQERLSRTIKYAPTYHVTISLFTPTAIPSDWEIETAMANYFIPLLDSLSAISNFTVETQVQRYAKFAPSVHAPQKDADCDAWTLLEEDLSGFVNAAEWPLSPSIGAGPTINFIIYVPDAATSPLVIKGSHATNWLVPQWGGVYILNPSESNRNGAEVDRVLSQDRLRPALLTFSQQLLAFMGAPHTPSSLPLQLQTLTRLRAASLLLSASSTMGSLARLTMALPSIAIPSTVSAAVDTTLRHLEGTCSALKQGRFQDALVHARVAEEQAERGFFEKSMVGQVYFPDEHKVAVYLPLLGPIGVPLLMSAFKELKKYLASRRVKAA